MKKLLMGLSILFTVLTFVGAGYVLSTGGEAGAGFATVPMVITVALQAAYRKVRNK